MSPPNDHGPPEGTKVSARSDCITEEDAAASEEESRKLKAKAEEAAKLAKAKQRYRYFDTPEGQDIDKKLLVILEPAVITGIVVSTMDVVCMHVPRTYPQIVGRYAYLTFPFVGVAAAFVSVTNLAARMRKTDDRLNWVAGGIASGLAFGVWWGTGVGTVSAACAFTLLALIQKDVVQNGWHWIPTSHYHPPMKPISHRWHDYSLISEKPRNWVKTEAERDAIIQARAWKQPEEPPQQENAPAPEQAEGEQAEGEPPQKE